MRPALLAVLLGPAALGVLPIGLPLAVEARVPAIADKTVTLLGDGVGAARFGQSEQVAVSDLDKALASTRAKVFDMAGNCTVDLAVQWRVLTAYFDHGRFVGYSTLAANGEPLTNMNLVTAKGLRVWDTLAEARRLYDGALTTTLAQGGAWFAKTPDGRLEGYLSAEVYQTKPPPRIASIEAGKVGCPAATP